MRDNNPFGDPFTSMFGDMFDTGFDATVDGDYSEETTLAIKMFKASETLDEFLDYIEDNDIDIEDFQSPRYIESAETDELTVLFGMMRFATSLERLNDHVTDDDNPFRMDDDNPFR